ncbi:MAG TPA: lipase maturation factor family protein [Streptosporangiaceae bacterium]
MSAALWAPDYWLSRLVFQRGLALVYLVAYIAAARQFRPLIGANGLTPAPRTAAALPFRTAPSLFHWRYSDRMFAIAAWTGAVLAAAALGGVTDRLPVVACMAVWAVLWALYLSIVNVGGTWYGFGWEILLLEAGFLAIFTGPAGVAPPVAVLWMLRWLLFRLEFGAGLIKMRGDPCWRDLTCLDHHHETQPMPGPLSWFFHHLPAPLHRVECAANHFAQLIVPFALFAPQPAAAVAAAVMIVTQVWLLLSGNFAWLNVLTIVLALPVLGDAAWRHVLPVPRPDALAAPGWFALLGLVVAVALAALSYRPVRNMLSSRQLMNASFDGLHLVNTYGAFGSVSRRRLEVVVEGTAEAEPEDWRAYEFHGKPTDPRRWPRQFAPYHLRLDWAMWFAALSRDYARPWFGTLLHRLLDADPATLRLLRADPFEGARPAAVRASLYEYRFSSWRRLRAERVCWTRTRLGVYWPAVRRD